MELPDNWQEILDRYLKQEQQSGEAVANITLDESLKKEIENVTRYASMEPGERSTFIGLLTDIYGKDNVTVCNNETFYKMLEDSSNGEFSDTLRDRNGMAYGFAQGEKIVLNEDLFNAHTPMHEHTHIYMKVLQATNPRLYARGMELWRNTPLWNQARRGLEILGETPTDEKIFSECMAQFTGSENEKIISEVTGITDKNWIKKALSWIQEMWQGVKSSFSRWTGKDLEGLTTGQFASMPVRAIYDAKERQVYKSKLEQYKQAMEAIGRDAAGVEGHIKLKEDLETARSSNGAVLYREGDNPKNSLVPKKLTKYHVEKIFGGIWIADKQEFAKFASAVRSKDAIELDGEGITYTDNYFYAYYYNIDGVPIPYASVYLNADVSQELVKEIQYEIIERGITKRMQVYYNRAVEVLRNTIDKDRHHNSDNSSEPNRRRNVTLSTKLQRKGRYFYNPSLFVKTGRVDGNGRGVLDEVFRQAQAAHPENESQITEAANRTAGSLHLDNVTILGEEEQSSLTPRQQRAKGWFDPKTGRIYINASNHSSTDDVVRTVLHEAVAHYGLRALFGKDFDTMLDQFYRAAGSEIRQAIMS